MTVSQRESLREIPRSDMLVDPDGLGAVLDEPVTEGTVSTSILIASLAISIALCIAAALWWIA